MALKLYNTLTRKKEIFRPIHKGKAGIYSCGLTVYDLENSLIDWFRPEVSAHLKTLNQKELVTLLNEGKRERALRRFVNGRLHQGFRDARKALKSLGHDLLYVEKGAYTVLKNTAAVRTPELDVQKVSTGNIDEIPPVLKHLDEVGLALCDGEVVPH